MPVDKDGAPCGYDGTSGEVGRHLYIVGYVLCEADSIIRSRDGAFGGAVR